MIGGGWGGELARWGLGGAVILALHAGAGYWLVHAESRRNAPKIKAFRDWILARTAELRED